MLALRAKRTTSAKGREQSSINSKRDEALGLSIRFVLTLYRMKAQTRLRLTNDWANERLGLAVDLRCYEQCAEIVRDLGLNRVRLISNNPDKLEALEQMGLVVVERVSPVIPTADAAIRYLLTKKKKISHLLEVA